MRNNRWVRWSRMGVFAPDRSGVGCREHRRGRAQDRHDRRGLPEGALHGLQPAGEFGGQENTPEDCFPDEGGPDGRRGRLIGRRKGGLNTKRHAVSDASGRPLQLFMTAGQVSDHTGAAALPSGLPTADWQIADRGYDEAWFREELPAGA